MAMINIPVALDYDAAALGKSPGDLHPPILNDAELDRQLLGHTVLFNKDKLLVLSFNNREQWYDNRIFNDSFNTISMVIDSVVLSTTFSMTSLAGPFL